MDAQICKACGSRAMVPMEVDVDFEDAQGEAIDPDAESRFFSCYVCGDNWLSVRESETDDCQVTFVHQMGMQPTLKRIAHTQAPVLVNDEMVDYWEYFLDGEPIDEDIWHRKLKLRRKILKSICCN